MTAWRAPYASNRLTGTPLPEPPDTWETIARELHKHLKALNEVLFDDRYSEKGPCAGCFDAVLAFETFDASPAASTLTRSRPRSLEGDYGGG